MAEDRSHKKVKKGDWHTEQMPSENTILSIQKTFTPEEYGELQKGILPEQMEDKWFIYFEDDRLYFHRSWTGHCTYIAEFEKIDGGYYCISRVIVNRNKDQYSEQDDTWDTMLLLYLIDSMLLHKPVLFPKHPSIDSEDKQVLNQWGLLGRHMLGPDNQ